MSPLRIRREGQGLVWTIYRSGRYYVSGSPDLRDAIMLWRNFMRECRLR